MSELPTSVSRQADEPEIEAGTDRFRYGIAIQADDDRSDATLRAVARARRHGYAPLLFLSTSATDISSTASAIGARTVKLSADQSFRTTLANVIDGSELDGVAVHSDVDHRVAYDRIDESIFNDDQIVNAPNGTHTAAWEVVAGIPAYNEGDSVGDVVRSVREYVDEVLVVDDGSDDNTAEVAREAGAVVITHEDNQGYGAALKTVFAEADVHGAEHLVMIDGDGQHDASDIPKLVDEQRQCGAEVVIGSRFAPGSETEMPLYRRFGVAVVNGLTNLSLGVVRPRSFIRDTQSGFRAYSRSAIKSLAADGEIGGGMNASTDILYHGHGHGYDFREVGTTIDYDVDDGSTHHPVLHGLRLVSNILRTIERERPITLLGIPGLVMISMGVVFAYWTVSNFLSSETFPLGLATVAGFLSIAGAFSTFTGIILHSLNTHLDR